MRQPTKFGKYLLLERIAVGGMAEVFVAKAFGVEGFERLLAIKKILPTMGEDAEFISMFVDEARIAVQLSHANVVQVLELGKHDESLYIAMEYISGRDVRQLLERFRKRQQPMPIPQACLIVAEVCAALDYAHRKRDTSGRSLGIVHRDVSPQNVLVSFEGEVKLIDFGIAKAESRLQKKTQAGILKGKFSYMSPEQVKGLPTDGRSDIFAAGILLWELVCGERLFTGDSDFAILEKVRKGLVPAPRSVTPTCPEGLEKVILKALATEPTQRYQTAHELHDDLMRFTMMGDMVYGSRQLAEWLREEFSHDWDNEQARLRGWLQVGAENCEVTPLAFRIAPDADTLASPPTPPKGVTPAPRPPTSGSHELPTMKMDDSTLVQAEKEFAARQAAMKAPFKSRPPRAEAKQDRRWMLYLGAPLALGMLATLGFALRLDGAKRPGRIVVTPWPSVGADLFIDGQHAGQLPPFVHSVAAGTHRVEVRARGYKPFSTEVLVPSGGRPMEIDAQLAPDGPMQLEGVVLTQPRPEHIAERVKLVMRPAESPKTSQPKNGATVARLRIVTEPAGAEVRVDGKVVGTSPVTTGPLDPGPYHPVIATLDGYAPARRAAKLDPTGTSEVSLFFEMEAPRLAEAAPVPSAAVGYLTAATKPAARLTIDGRDTGRWTPVPAANPIALPPGAHTLLFETADGRKLEEQFEIEPGKTSRVIRSLP